MIVQCVEHEQFGEKMLYINTWIPLLKEIQKSNDETVEKEKQQNNDETVEIEEKSQDFPVDLVFNIEILIQEFIIKRL